MTGGEPTEAKIKYASPVEWGAVGGKDKNENAGAGEIVCLERGVKGTRWFLDFALIEMAYAPKAENC